MTLEQYKNEIEAYLKRAELELAHAESKVRTYKAKLANIEFAYKKSKYGKEAKAPQKDAELTKTRNVVLPENETNSARIHANSPQNEEKAPKSVYDDFGALMFGKKP